MYHIKAQLEGLLFIKERNYFLVEFMVILLSIYHAKWISIILHSSVHASLSFPYCVACLDFRCNEFNINCSLWCLNVLHGLASGYIYYSNGTTTILTTNYLHSEFLIHRIFRDNLSVPDHGIAWPMWPTLWSI